MGLPGSGAGHAPAAAERARLRARCRVQSGRQWPSSGRPRAARESDARSNCCTRRSHDDCATATGWPGKRRPIAPLAVPLARPHRAVRPCRSAGTLSARVSPNRCSLALRAPMHACRQAELAGRTPSAPLDGRMCRLRARVLRVLPGRLGIAMTEVCGRCPLGIGTHCGRPASQSHGRQPRGARSVRWSTARRRAPFAPTRSCRTDRCALCLPAPASARARRHTHPSPD